MLDTETYLADDGGGQHGPWEDKDDEVDAALSVFREKEGEEEVGGDAMG
jgi:hypothetical protein